MSEGHNFVVKTNQQSVRMMRKPLDAPSTEPARIPANGGWRNRSGRLTRLLLPALLTLLLLITLSQIFFGRNSLSRNAEMERKIQELRARNEALKQENQAATKSTQDPERRLEVIEGKARSELGLIKRDEIFIQTEEAPAVSSSSSGSSKEPSAAPAASASGARKAN